MNRLLHLVAIAASILAIILASFQKDDLIQTIVEQQYKKLNDYTTEVTYSARDMDIDQFNSLNGRQLFGSFLKKPNHSVFISDGEKWVYWSTNQINPKIANEDCDSFIRLLNAPTGFDFVVFRSNKHYKFYFVSHLKNNPALSESHPELLPEAPYDDWIFSSSIRNEGVQLFSENGDFILNAIVSNLQTSKLLWIDFTLLLLIGLIVFSYCRAHFSVGLSSSLAISFMLIIYRLLYSTKLGFEGMYNFKLFSASAYASSAWIPSLGDLLVNGILFFLLTVIFLQKGEESFKRNKDLSWLYGGIILFINCIVFFYISSLFNDSQVSFNFNDLSSINNYSFLGVFIVLIWFMILHYLNASFFRNFEVSLAQVVATLLFLLLLSQVTLVGLSEFLLLGLCFFTFYYVLHWLSNKFAWSNLLLIEFVIFSFLFTFINQNVSHNKEKNYRKYYLKHAVYDRKEFIENELRIAESKIADDTLLLGSNLLLDKDINNVSKRVSQLYFNSISKDYEINIYSFTEDGQNIFEPGNQLNVSYLKAQYNNLPFNERLNYFKRINDHEIPIDYLAKYDKCDEDGNEIGGAVYLSLTHKSFAVQELESTNFSTWLSSEYRNKDYSYAIYDDNGYIEKRKGSINYSVALPSEYIGLEDTFVNQNGVSHYILKHPVYNQVNIVSINEPGWGNILTNFSFFALVCIVIAIIILLIIYLTSRFIRWVGSPKLAVNVSNYINKWVPILQFNNLFLSRKIIVSLVSIVVVAFLITLFIVLRFIQESEKSRLAVRHYAKVEETINRLEGKSFGDILIENRRTGFLLALANELNKDILIYGKHGELFASTSTQIEKGEFFAPLVPFRALETLSSSNTGIEKIKSKIGQRTFTSYFYSILDDNQELTGILSVPHFEQETILNSSASNLIKTLVNLYAILSVFGIIVVFYVAKGISKPLNILSNRLADLNLGGSYKPIQWRGNDEIAQLVRQYNLTVKQLKISTDKLAETERQGAWKEMAKQVAHEIKNPLTPMRLNLQHLQRTLMQGKEGAEEKRAKIIEVLLAQINKLTRLADDFGSFARITESNPEVISPCEVVDEVVMLYDKEPNVHVQNNVNNPEAQIHMDKVAFERVLNNVFKNAVQAMNADGKIIVSDYIKDDHYVLLIADTGKGISEELKDKIFSPNFSTKTSGMGIGLALSKRIIENAKGQISFESEMGMGTTFTIRIPLHL